MEDLLTVYIRQREFEKAEALIEKSEPRPFYRLCIGDMELAKGNEETARQIWQDTAQTYCNDGWTLFQCGERFEKIGDAESALKLYEDSYTRSPEPKWMDSLYARVFLYEKLGRIEEAAAMWQNIIDTLARDYGITSGETVDWAKRELSRLKSSLPVHKLPQNH